MKKDKIIIFIIAVVMLISGGILTGCGNTIPESEVSYASPMLDNILAGIKDNNYSEFAKDFSNEMKNALPEESFHSLVSAYATKIGDYESKSFAGATNITKDNKTFTVVVYKAKYSKEPNGVTITITFSDTNGQKIVEGLFFKSPNLEK